MTGTEHDWRHRAACGLDDIALFELAAETGPHAKRARAEAFAKCMWCPVLAECKEDVMRSEGNTDSRSREGFRAGMTVAQRVALAKGRRNHRRVPAPDTTALDAALDRLEQKLLDQQIAFECGPDTDRE